MNTERTGCTPSTSSSSSPALVAPTVGVKKEKDDQEATPPPVHVVSSSSAASSRIPSTRMPPMKKEEPEEGGAATDTIGTSIDGTRRAGALRGVKKEEDDLEDDQQNTIPTATIPSASSSSTVPDPSCSNSSSNNSSNGSSDGMEVGNTDWRTGDWCWVVVEDEAHTNDDKEDDGEEADVETSIETNTRPAIVVPSSAVGVKQEESEDVTPRPPLQIIARSKATDPTRPDHITLCPRRTKTRKQKMKQKEEQQNHDGHTDRSMSTNSNNRDDDDYNVAVDDAVAAAVVTGTNRKRKSNHYSRDHLKRKRSKRSVQANTDNSTITNLDDDDTNDGIVHNDDGDDGSYNRNNDDDPESENDDDGSIWNNDNNDNNSGIVMADTTMTNRGEIIPHKFDERWNEMYIRLIAYNNKYQSTRVPIKCGDDPGLMKWVSTQRTLYNTNRLTKKRIKQLNSIDFVWDLYEARWMEMYERLVAYKDQYGSTCVPCIYAADSELGLWVLRQRQCYHNTGNCKLSVDRRNLLNSIGFVWNARDAKWTEMYERLVAYKEQYGSTCVPRSYTADPQLGEWVDSQRKNFSNTSNRKLFVDRRNLLNSIGFVWNARDAKWTKMYERLVAYKEQYGSTCVRKSYKADPQLATWVNTQRTSYNRNSSKLTAAKKQQLNSIGFVWKVKK